MDLAPVLRRALDRADGAFEEDYALLLAYCGDASGREFARKLLRNAEEDAPVRLRAFNVLIDLLEPGKLLPDVQHIFDQPSRSGATEFRGAILASLGRLDDPKIAPLVLRAYPKLDPSLQPRAVELLTQRTSWSRALMEAVGKGVVPASAVNVNQIRRLLGSKDAELSKLVKERWGILRETRNPAREHVIRDVCAMLRKTPGDAAAGSKIFQRICGQCHKIYGEGQDVGPEITLNGRSSYEQLLSNVFDPSLVIGAAYQATILATTDGRVLTGLLVEKSPDRVVLKTQGGKVETIPARQIEEVKTSALSLMPEDLEKQLSARELADLFAFLTLDKPPSDPNAKRLPGAEELAR